MFPMETRPPFLAKGHPMTSGAKVVTCFAMLALLAGVVFTQETNQDKDSKPESADAKPPTHKIEKKDFRIELTVKGILEPEETSPISFRPQRMLNSPVSHEPLSIKAIVEHGATVKKGDVLVTFDSTKINEIIDDLDKERKVLDAAIKLTEEELPLLEKSAPVDLAAAETAKKLADQELKYFLEIGRAQTEKQTEMFVKMEKYYLEYSQEQLRQLEKMYKANDLTEETEKIILRRQQQAVEMATFFYQAALIDRDYIMKYTLPNKEKALRDEQIKANLQLEKTRRTAEPVLAQKKAALTQMLYNRTKNAVRLQKLQEDRAAMTIVAPMDGIVYHGKFQKGQWTTPGNRLQPNGTVTPDDIFLTVVKARPVVLHLTIDEKDVHLVKVGLQGKAKLPFQPDRKLPAKVTKLAGVPATAGKFDALVEMETDAADALLMPGMACSVKFVPYSKSNAIAVPAKCIHEEDDRYFVYMYTKGGKEEKRDVTPGRTGGEQTEILAGLREGEEILLERPTQPPATPAKAKGDSR
jgi:multidrug efflux pump subunit AcrA (membrane-fusion protein)